MITMKITIYSLNAGNFPTLRECRNISYTQRMPEIFLHSENAGKFPALRECRKISYTQRMPEIFLHSENAGNFPTLRECRKISRMQRMPEIFLDSENAGNFPGLRECRKFSENAGKFPTLTKMQDNYETYVRHLPMQERCCCFVSWSFQIAGEDFSLCAALQVEYKSLSNLSLVGVAQLPYRTKQAVAV